MSKSQSVGSLSQEQKLKFIKQTALLPILIGGGAGVGALISFGIPNLPNRYGLLAGAIFQITLFLILGIAMWRTVDAVKAQKVLLIFALAVIADAILQLVLQGAQHRTEILVSHTFLALFAITLRNVLRH